MAEENVIGLKLFVTKGTSLEVPSLISSVVRRAAENGQTKDPLSKKLSGAELSDCVSLPKMKTSTT
jgi:hypothetical protein